jgi:hypothetical protein
MEAPATGWEIAVMTASLINLVHARAAHAQRTERHRRARRH